MIDVVREIEAVQRESLEASVGGVSGRALRLQREYDAPIEDVWDALTNPERLTRWFLPISGDYRLGGRYQFEGNAGGEILACERPNRFKVTWGYGEAGDPSEVEVRLSPADGGATRFELEHTAVVPEEMWGEYGPGAVGIGWDQGLLGLALHLRGESVGDPTAWQLSAEGREFTTKSSESWGEANRAAGAAPEVVERGVANSTAFYAPEAEAGA